MKVVDTLSNAPIEVQQSVRAREVRCLTSCRAGKIVPLYAAPLLREDRLSVGDFNITLDMAETIHPLLNSVGVTVMAHFLSFSAFERFASVDSLNKSYLGIKDRPTDAAPVPFFQMGPFPGTPIQGMFYETMGLHSANALSVNTAYLEAYNTVVNFLYRIRSKSLPQRLMTDTTLAQAFWNHPFMWHIKPDFDAAMMDGDIDLRWLTTKAPVVGISQTNNSNPASGGASHATTSSGIQILNTAAPGNGQLIFKRKAGNPSGTELDIYAEMQAMGIRLTLQNIHLAEKTKSFAVLREKFKGRSDQDLVDLLMSGIRIPDEDLKEPILLAKQQTVFGYSERHAMDGASLDKSVTTGRANVRMRVRTPPMNTGGIILITAQIVPEQMFERMQDPLLNVSTVAELPDFLRDFLDPEKVEVVKNSFIDVHHATPNGTFGYAPLNHKWKGADTRIGGKFYRPQTYAFNEDRQRIWSVETLNPALNSSVYLVPSDLPHTVFADTLADAFEITTLGHLQIVGNTQFGEVFEEDSASYEDVSAVADSVAPRLGG